MAAPAKFLFDVDFGGRQPGGGADDRRSPTHAAELAEAEARGYRDGFAPRPSTKRSAEAERRTRGRARAHRRPRIDRAGREPRRRSKRGSKPKRSRSRSRSRASSRRADRARAVRRDRGAGGRLLPRSCAARRTWSCASTTRCYADAREQLDEIARARGFEGRLVVLASPTSRPATAASNGPTAASMRDRAATEAAIGEAVARYVAAQPQRRREPRRCGETSNERHDSKVPLPNLDDGRRR